MSGCDYCEEGEGADLIKLGKALKAIMEIHPDGTCLRERLEEELGDVLAAYQFVATKLDLDGDKIAERVMKKLALFHQWENEP